MMQFFFKRLLMFIPSSASWIGFNKSIIAVVAPIENAHAF
jgi:hypothetical protein